jgi:hypothetical protein
MTKPTPVPPCAYLLADHLDCALAAGEDILAAGRRLARSAAATGPGQVIALRTTVELIRSLELALITRVIKAREWSQTLGRLDGRFKLIGRSFASGTNTLVDAVAEFADSTEADFETGDGITAYFRSRSVIDVEAPDAATVESLKITETFLVTRRIELGALLDLVAAYLDALEVHFLLFGEERDDGITPPVASASDISAAAPRESPSLTRP